MLLNGKAILGLTEQDLLDLITREETEKRTIDFKRDPIGNSADAKKEFLADVSSFANASGGFLVYGIDEDEGKPIDLVGLSVPDTDQEILRLENMIRDGVAQRISGITIQPIPLSGGNVALVMEIPKSWVAPHMVTLGGSSKFFSRNSRGKYQLDVHELRQAFVFSDALSDRIRNFRLDRLSKLEAGEEPVSMLQVNGGTVILHLIPISAFQSSDMVDLQKVRGSFHLLPPLNDHTNNYHRFNLDGLLTYSPFGQGVADSYTQLFRNGVVEAVDKFILNASMFMNPNPSRVIVGNEVESVIIKQCQAYLKLFEFLGVSPPVLVFLSLIGVKGYEVSTRVMTMRRFDLQPIDRDRVLIPEVVIESYPVDNLPFVLKPMFDTLWNASGWEGSPSYRVSGEWVKLP